MRFEKHGNESGKRLMLIHGMGLFNRKNPNKGESSSISEQLEKQYWIEENTLYHETFSKITRVVYHAKIRKDESLSIAWSIDEVILVLGAVVLTIVSAWIRQWILFVLALFVLLVAGFMLVVENFEMRNTYAKAKERIYRVSKEDTDSK